MRGAGPRQALWGREGFVPLQRAGSWKCRNSKRWEGAGGREPPGGGQLDPLPKRPHPTPKGAREVSKPCSTSSRDQLSRGSSARVFSSSSLTAAPNTQEAGQLRGSRCGPWRASPLWVVPAQGHARSVAGAELLTFGNPVFLATIRG